MDSREVAEMAAKKRKLLAEQGMPVERLTFSAATTAKAARLIETGKVHRCSDPYEKFLWTVDGDHGTYKVRYDALFEVTGKVGFLLCTCPLSEWHTGMIAYCSHALAVVNSMLAETKKDEVPA